MYKHTSFSNEDLLKMGGGALIHKCKFTLSDVKFDINNLPKMRTLCIVNLSLYAKEYCNICMRNQNIYDYRNIRISSVSRSDKDPSTDPANPIRLPDLFLGMKHLFQISA